MCVCACYVCYWVLGESTLFRFRCIGHSWCIVGPAGRWWEEQRRRRSVGPDGDADRTPTVADAVTAGCAYAELSKAPTPAAKVTPREPLGSDRAHMGRRRHSPGPRPVTLRRQRLAEVLTRSLMLPFFLTHTALRTLTNMISWCSSSESSSFTSISLNSLLMASFNACPIRDSSTT